MGVKRIKHFRVTGMDETDDIHAVETNDRQRARYRLEEFKTIYKDAQTETQRWL